MGGVLLRIDYLRTINAFKSHGIRDFDEKYTQANQDGFFDLFETGIISTTEFYQKFFNWGFHMDMKAIDNYWNKMLLDFPLDHLNVLAELAKRFNLFLLSNTNEIHYTAFRKIVSRSVGWDDFTKMFGGIYLSHQIGHRKPNTEAFKHVLKQSGITPEHTIFIDDSQQHVSGAKRMGIRSFLYPQNEPLNVGMANILTKLNEHT